jgi:sugar phosphate isomerase/epimerase
MRIGIFGRTFPGADPETVLDRVAGAGYATVHWNMASAGLPSMPDAVPDGLPRRIAEAARARGLAIAGLSGTYNMIHPDPSQRARGLARLACLIKAARGMGAPLVTLCTGTRDPDDQWCAHPGNASPEAWTDLLAEMERAVLLAESAGLRLGIEPETANVVSDPAKARRLLDELQSPALAIVLDPANLFDEPPEPAALRDAVARAVDLLGPDLAMAHAKDRDAQGRVVATGQGVIDFAHFADCLRRAGFDGDVVTHGLAPEEAPAVAEFLKRTFA